MGINLPGRNTDQANKGYSISFTHLGRRGYNLTLYAQTWVSRKKWFEHIEEQQRLIRERSLIFRKVVVCEKYFLGNNNKVSCAVAFGEHPERVTLTVDGGRKLAYGTDSGIYVSDRKPHSNVKTTPVRVHSISNVTQIDVLEEYGLLLVLCDKTLLSYPIELLTDHDNSGANFQMNRKAKKLSGNCHFFKSGICLGRVLLCIVKAGAGGSNVRVLEPVEGLNRGRGKLGLAKFLQGGQDFRVFQVYPLLAILIPGILRRNRSLLNPFPEI
jgi:RHO1 GDP-GTP exchange protein 1/2